MEISEQGKAFIKARETCRLSPHFDSVAGVWDIAWGHRFKDGEPRVAITQEEADAIFDIDILYYESAVNDSVTVEISQPIHDCLVSFAYNAGTGALKTSTLLLYVNASMFSDAVVELLTWNKSRGAFVPGLLNRRAREALIFARGEYWP